MDTENNANERARAAAGNAAGLSRDDIATLKSLARSMGAGAFFNRDDAKKLDGIASRLECTAPAEKAVVQGWIRVQDRMPEPGGLYLVDSTWGVRPAWRHEPAWADGCFQDAINSSDEGTTDFDGHCKGVFRVTRWMPMPSADKAAAADAAGQKGGAA